MFLEDLLAAFYYRTVEARQMLHTCKIGYCKSSPDGQCKFGAPATSVESGIRLDEETQRLVARRSHLDDDAYVKLHSLPLLLRSLMNIQTNQHHPHDGVGSLGYQIKYSLKYEPQTVLRMGQNCDDEVIKFLKGQFISASAAAAFVLGDPITSCTRVASPLLFPSWSVAPKAKCQGLWKRYVTRIPYHFEEEPRYGVSRTVGANVLQVSVIFATPLRLLRYFGDGICRANKSNNAEENGESSGAEDDTEDDADGGAAAAAARLPVPDSLTAAAVHPPRLSRHVFDAVSDDPSHPSYDVVFSELLPGEKLLFGSQVTDVFQRVRNGRVRFARFMEYDLSLRKDIDGMSSRSHYFRIRLFRHLPWFWDPASCRLLSPAPFDITPGTVSYEASLGTVPLQSIPCLSRWLPPSCRNLVCLWLQTMDTSDDAPFDPETLCMQVETCSLLK